MKMYKVKTLAQQYGVHRNTFGRWLKRNPRLAQFTKRKVLFQDEYLLVLEVLGEP